MQVFAKRVFAPFFFIFAFSAQADKGLVDSCERRTGIAHGSPFLFYHLSHEPLLNAEQIAGLRKLYDRYENPAMRELTEVDRGAPVQLVFILETEKTFRPNVTPKKATFITGATFNRGPDRDFLVPIADQIFEKVHDLFSQPDVSDSWKNKRKLRLSLNAFRYTLEPGMEQAQVPWHRDEDCLLQGILFLQKPTRLRGGLNGIQMNAEARDDDDPSAERAFFKLESNQALFFDGQRTLHTVQSFSLPLDAGPGPYVRDILAICVE